MFYFYHITWQSQQSGLENRLILLDGLNRQTLLPVLINSNK